ncbi:hypothetical protein H5410_018051 [Solanum commersonii]|uniref:Uncharacterized protein n=1 Tax=Solanum commersonii TaxID=4109 RepID=A0A9J6A1R8_SOLCO|nr:hypothetical protein H5410_018051 [Solanum commersonii]
MENLLTTYEFQFWTDDFIIPNTINLNNNPSTSPLFFDRISDSRISPVFARGSNAVIGDDDNNICEILSYLGVPLHRMPTVIGDISSFAQSMMAQPANFSRPLLPIEVYTCNPRDLEIAHQRKYGFIPEIEEEDKPMDKRRRID